MSIRRLPMLLLIWVSGLLIANSVFSAEGAESICADAGLSENAFGICQAYCEALDCTSGNADSTACNELKSQFLSATGSSFPCEQKICELLEPALLFERISKISNPEYVCYADSNTPYTYVEYIIRSEGIPQIGLGMEDTFDGNWYGYYFEFQQDSDGTLPEFFRYDLTAEDVQACREAFEPPFHCSP